MLLVFITSILVMLQKSENNIEFTVKGKGINEFNLRPVRKQEEQENKSPSISSTQTKNESRKESPSPTTYRLVSSVSRLQPSSLDTENINKIRILCDSGSNLIQGTAEFVSLSTAKEAFDYLNTNLSMVYSPEKYFVDGHYFYFSGGTKANKVEDFSSGLRVDKNSGSIVSW